MEITMASGVEILTVRQARASLPTLVKRAEQQHEEIHLGAQGEDQVTLIASADLRELKALAQIGQQALAGRLPASDPWAGVKRALAEGHLSAAGTFARAYQTQADERETRSWAEMAASGNADNREPEFRRRFIEEAQGASAVAHRVRQDANRDGTQGATSRVATSGASHAARRPA